MVRATAVASPSWPIDLTCEGVRRYYVGCLFE